MIDIDKCTLLNEKQKEHVKHKFLDRPDDSLSDDNKDLLTTIFEHRPYTSVLVFSPEDDRVWLCLAEDATIKPKEDIFKGRGIYTTYDDLIFGLIDYFNDNLKTFTKYMGITMDTMKNYFKNSNEWLSSQKDAARQVLKNCTIIHLSRIMENLSKTDELDIVHAEGLTNRQAFLIMQNYGNQNYDNQNLRALVHLDYDCKFVFDKNDEKVWLVSEPVSVFLDNAFIEDGGKALETAGFTRNLRHAQPKYVEDYQELIREELISNDYNMYKTADEFGMFIHSFTELVIYGNWNELEKHVTTYKLSNLFKKRNY